MDQPHTGGGLISPPELSPMEQEILEEYERLATNMKTVRAVGLFAQAGWLFANER